MAHYSFLFLNANVSCIINTTRFSLLGISVSVKECPVCKCHVRFQEYDSGFHNFDNHVFLTLPLCEMLLSGLAVS